MTAPQFHWVVYTGEVESGNRIPEIQAGLGPTALTFRFRDRASRSRNQALKELPG